MNAASKWWVVVLAGVTGAVQAQSLPFNGGFEQGFAGWSVANAPVGSWLVATTNSPGGAHTGSGYAAFLDYAEQYDSLTQSLSTTPGQQYRIDLWLRIFAVNPGTHGSFQAVWAGAPAIDLSDQSAQGSIAWMEYTGLVTATSAATPLQLRAYGAFYLDDVTVTPVPAPGGSCLVLAAGAVLRRRRRGQAPLRSPDGA